MQPIRIAIVGVGNCASALVQGIHYYRQLRRNSPVRGHNGQLIGLMHDEIGGYRPGDIEVVAAFDIDRRKVGRPLAEALVAPPNNTMIFYPDVPRDGVTVQMGPILDGFSGHMNDYPEDRRFVPAELDPVDVERVLRDSGAEILVSYLPVGSQQAGEFWAQTCLNTGVSLVNCIPVFIVSDPTWGRRFAERGIPCVGDDIKAQLGATIVHRALAKLFQDRGMTIDNTYQLNTGGNTDFLNMLNRARLTSKKVSKTEAVQAQLNAPVPADHVHVGPSDFVPWQKDNKVCFIRMEGRGFGGVAMNLELRLSVEDSPNSGGVSIDAIRGCKLARDRGLTGPLEAVCAYTMKHPPRQMPDDVGLAAINEFIKGGAAG